MEGKKIYRGPIFTQAKTPACPSPEGLNSLGITPFIPSQPPCSPKATPVPGHPTPTVLVNRSSGVDVGPDHL